MPKISVIMPCYNYGKYVDEAVNSVLEQTFQDFEIIIINDGSTDEYTNELLRDYNRPKTKVIFIKNQGPSIARNIGIENSQGEYILPLDADDKLERTYLEKAVKILDENPQIGVVYCEAEFFEAKQGKWDLPQYSLDVILLQNVIFNTAFYRRSDWKKVGGYNANMIYGMEDYDFWLSLIEIGIQVYRIPEVLFYYRIKAESRTIGLSTYNTDMFVQMFMNHQKLYIENIKVLISNKIFPDLTSNIFIDTGRGFNENEIIVLKSHKSNYKDFNFDFFVENFKFIESLRFDPLEGSWCRTKITQVIYEDIYGSLKEVDLNKIGFNGNQQPDGFILFHTVDPMFFIPIKGQIKSISIKGTLEILDMWYVDSVFQGMDKSIQVEENCNIGRVNFKRRVFNFFKSAFGGE